MWATYRGAKMKALVLVLAVALTSCVYTEASTDLRWDTPVERENGDQLFIYEIDHFELSIACEGLEEQIVELNNEAISMIVNVVGTCTFKILAVDTDGLASEYTEEKTITIKTPPRAPFNFRIFGN